ncbi:putative inactive purple acid phosphatase [Trifolium repens]|nr:putative inactive purple acid phosphatase [Trifolium repens]
MASNVPPDGMATSWMKRFGGRRWIYFGREKTESESLSRWLVAAPVHHRPPLSALTLSPSRRRTTALSLCLTVAADLIREMRKFLVPRASIENVNIVQSEAELLRAGIGRVGAAALFLYLCGSCIGDNIFGADSSDSAKSMDAAFAPAIASNIPWLNSILPKYTSLTVLGTITWKLVVFKKSYIKGPVPQKESAPGLAYFHIPLPEYASFDSSNFTGVKLKPSGANGNGISSASVNSGFFTTLVGAGDVKAVFVGHDHLNDFCGKLMDIQLCYAGGFGYHAYGKAGWSRRARVVVASLEKTDKGSWGDVKSVKSWKRLDDQHLTGIDGELLWSKSFHDSEMLDLKAQMVLK